MWLMTQFAILLEWFLFSITLLYQKFKKKQGLFQSVVPVAIIITYTQLFIKFYFLIYISFSAITFLTSSSLLSRLSLSSNKS